MSVLLLRLAGPMQAWGSSSRFAYRTTEVAPTKSGVIGMLAAARGIRRTEPLTELLGLRFGVRIDQPGQVVRDFQTARPPGEKHSLLSYRFYLSDAVFLAAVSGEDESLLRGLDEALRRPHFPLYLGRRSCPPAGAVSRGVRPGELEQVLATWGWEASSWYRKKAYQTTRLEVIRDARPGETEVETMPDEPLSFDPARRQHIWRSVVRTHVPMHNPDGIADDHDPFALVGG